MGLYISHNTWSGGYGAFHEWRKEIANKLGLPPLELMEGFYVEGQSMSDPFNLLSYHHEKDSLEMFGISRLRKSLPIKWECLRPNPIYELLYHSDCDGELSPESSGKIADELEKVLPDLDNEHRFKFKDRTEQFIKGLRDAADKDETVEFR